MTYVQKEKMTSGRLWKVSVVAVFLCLSCLLSGVTVLAKETTLKFGRDQNAVVTLKPGKTHQYTLKAKDYTLSYRFMIHMEGGTYVPEEKAVVYPDASVAVYDRAGNKLGERSQWTETEEGKDDYYLEIPKCRPGTYDVRVTNLSEKEITYRLEVRKVNNYGKVKLSKTTMVYNGKKQKAPAVTVYDAAGKKMKKSEYTYWFEGTRAHKWFDKKVSEVDGYHLYLYYGKEYNNEATYYYDHEKGEEVAEPDYSDRVERAFVMKPEQAKIKSKNIKNGKLTVRCEASRNARCYIWELAEDKEFKHIVQRDYWGTAKKVFQGLKKGKTYYVRVAIESTTYKKGEISASPITLKGEYSKPVKVIWK